MATERIPSPGEQNDDDEAWWDAYYASPEFRARVTRADADIAAGRGYVIGTEDLEEFINLAPEEQRRMTRDDLDAWLKARAAKYSS